MDLSAKADAFRRLHEQPLALVLPNVWDLASARIVEEAGFPALATTSSGIAFSLGHRDGERMGRDTMIGICGRIAARAGVPVSADLEAGYGPAPGDTAETVRRAIDAGIVGGNIEDGTRRREQPLCSLELAAARIRAAREAAASAGLHFVINARTDYYLSGGALTIAGFNETVRRGRVYREAGADCVFVPGLADRDTISRLVKAIGGPINVLARPGSPPVPELHMLGVKRVSIGGVLALATLGLVRRAAIELKEAGTYGFATGYIPHAEMNALFARNN